MHACISKRSPLQEEKSGDAKAGSPFPCMNALKQHGITAATTRACASKGPQSMRKLMHWDCYTQYSFTGAPGPSTSTPGSAMLLALMLRATVHEFRVSAPVPILNL